MCSLHKSNSSDDAEDVIAREENRMRLPTPTWASPYKLFRLPDLHLFTWRCVAESCVQRVALIKEALMAATWHPKRMVQWCLDECEKREFPVPVTVRHERTRVWFDEILVLDGDGLDLPDSFTTLKLDAGSTIKFVAMSGRGFVTVRGKSVRCVAFDSAKPYWIVSTCTSACNVCGANSFCRSSDRMS